MGGGRRRETRPSQNLHPLCMNEMVGGEAAKCPPGVCVAGRGAAEGGRDWQARGRAVRGGRDSELPGGAEPGWETEVRPCDAAAARAERQGVTCCLPLQGHKVSEDKSSSVALRSRKRKSPRAKGQLPG